MGAEFGLAGFDPEQREQLFGLLRGLRVAAGDFLPRRPPAPARPSRVTGAGAAAGEPGWPGPAAGGPVE